jgi:hypothetical protein
MDKYGRDRWMEIGSGGPESVTVQVKARESWVKTSVEKAKITPDGKNDVRVWLSIDWEVAGKAEKGHVDLVSSCGTKVVITLPLVHALDPPSSFKGSIQGDGYVAIEAGRSTDVVPASSNGQDFSWTELPFYGRTRSGLAIMPVQDTDFPLGKGPSVEYNFFLTTPPAKAVTAILHLGPTLNYILGKRLAFGIQLDEGEIKQVHPVPEAPLGSLPHDWEEVVAEEIRVVEVELPLNGRVGQHKLRLWGITTGIVVERVLIDLGGIRARGKSYLGPPESTFV